MYYDPINSLNREVASATRCNPGGEPVRAARKSRILGHLRSQNSNTIITPLILTHVLVSGVVYSVPIQLELLQLYHSNHRHAKVKVSRGPRAGLSIHCNGCGLTERHNASGIDFHCRFVWMYPPGGFNFIGQDGECGVLPRRNGLS